MKRRAGALLLGSLSFANLCVLNLWHDNQRLENPSLDYFRGAPAGNRLFLSTVLVVLLLTVVFLLVGVAVVRVRRPALVRGVRLAFILAFLYPLRLLHYAVVWSDLPPPWDFVAAMPLFVCYGGIVGAAAWNFLTQDPAPFKAMVRVNLVLSPLLAVVLLSHTVYLLRDAPGEKDFAPPTGVAADSGPAAAGRALWLIFDEFDYEIAFDRRPRDVRLTEFDRLRRESLFATNAYPPFGETLGSMPALINGKSYGAARVTGVNSLILREQDGRLAAWKSSDTVFARLRSAGRRAGVAGWYHPYCRIFGDALSECSFVPATKYVLLVRERRSRERSVFATGLRLLRRQLAFVPLVPAIVAPDMQEMARMEQLSEFVQVHGAALKQIINPALDVVMVHYPIPHPYGIYDRAAGKLSPAPRSTYEDNLALADRVLGEIRQALEASGLWNRTALVISSDHSLRDDRATEKVGMGRIPFVVRVPGDAAGRDYGIKLNTVISADLIQSLAGGRIRNLDDVAAWLARAARP